MSVDSGMIVIEVPEIEDLIIPDKNYNDSLEYLDKLLRRNDERLSELAQTSTQLGLTPLNKVVRATEDFLKQYKWPLVGLSTIAAACVVYNALSATAYSDALGQNRVSYAGLITQLYGSFTDTREYTMAFGIGGTITGIISREAYEAFVGSSAKTFFKDTASWMYRKYRAARTTVNELYDTLKGVQNVRRDGLATSLENTPTLEDSSFFGLEDIIYELNKIINQARDPELFSRSDTEIERGILFIGPSRCGKTAVAKALGATINKMYHAHNSPLKMQFIEINYLMIGREPASLRDLIGYALANAPCILFIDEIHLLALQKTGNKELLNEFLTQLTDLHKIKDPSKQVFIIAATNHPELLAPELFKHERFGKVIRFKKPGIRERAEFFSSTIQKYGINPEGIDLKSLVLQTRDCDYGHLQQIVKDARFEARANGQGVTQAHLQRSINSIVHGIGSTAELSKEEATIAAIDQAGKIVAHKKLEIHETIHLATIAKVNGKIEEDHLWLSDRKDTDVIPMRYGAVVATSNREEIPYSDSLELEKLCKRYIAGITAQKIILGTYHIDYTAHDYKFAFEIAQKLVLKGLTLKSLPQEQQNRVFQETEKLLQRFEAEVDQLLREHKDLIAKLAAELLKERCITGQDIDNIVQ
ncbi:unnamed protein product [Sphagnum balticum]